jgi:integrase
MLLLVRLFKSISFFKGLKMAQIYLNAGFIKAAVCPTEKKKVEFHDVFCKGLFLEARISGGKTYYLRYRDRRGRQRQIKLGDSRDLLLSDARKLADEKRRSIALGEDPLEIKSDSKKTPTFSAFINEQYLPHIKSYKRSWTSDVSLLNNHLLPRFGNKYLDEISRQDIVKMLVDRRASGAAAGSANRLLILMRYCFNLAIRWEVSGIKVNPTKEVPLLEDRSVKERYLSVEEAQRLHAAVCTSENTMLRFIVPTLILSGCRKREVLDAKWKDFDFQRRIWRIPTPKTGKARFVPISDGLINLLNDVPRGNGSEWVFPNSTTNKPFVNFFCAWDNARKKAGLSDVRVHDLRHSFASFLVNSGRTLFEVQRILGHTQVKTTQRYAHLSHDTLLDATNAVNSQIGHLFTPVLSSPKSTGLLPMAH